VFTSLLYYQKGDDSQVPYHCTDLSHYGGLGLLLSKLSSRACSYSPAAPT